MRSLAALLLVSFCGVQGVHAGAIADRFASGYGGIPWGMSLDDLVGTLPGGDHYFSTAPGERVYTLYNDDPIFDVPRPGMRAQYHFDKSNGVESIALAVPYERRDQLLGSLMALFGSYSQQVVHGTALIYYWRRDGAISLAVRASRDPKNGILEFWLAHAADTGARVSRH